MTGPPADRHRNLLRRARVLATIRHFFDERGYLEVETPIRIPVPAPEAHIDPEPSGQWYLHTSPELCMKRLLAGGFHKIYQICKCFRKNERGGRHLPEMTMLEWYTAGADYRHMMDQCEALIGSVAQALAGTSSLTYQNRIIDLSPPWDRLSVNEAFERYGDSPADTAQAQDRFDEVMGLQIEPRLGWERPVLLYDYPAACGALARLKNDRPEVAERFELYIGGLELCNGFSELTDPLEQRRRFQAEIDHRHARGKPGAMPEPFLAALARMPDATGNALGIDRLMMLLNDVDDIDQVVAFTPEAL